MSVAVSNPTKTLKLSTSTAGGAGPPANEVPLGLTSALEGCVSGQSTAEEEEEHIIYHHIMLQQGRLQSGGCNL